MKADFTAEGRVQEPEEVNNLFLRKKKENVTFSDAELYII
jgi:hypothetical protein